MVVDVEGPPAGQGTDDEPADAPEADEPAGLRERPRGCYRDRREAGERLAVALARLAGPETVVVALPRGGVLVGFEMAAALQVPLDIWVVRKIGLPGHEELGLGAVAEGGYTHLSRDIVAATGVSRAEVGRLIKRKLAEVEHRTELLRGARPRVPLAGKTVIIVDDGIATGGTIRAVAGALRRERPARSVLAVPVAAADTLESLASAFDAIVCPLRPVVLHAVGYWYDDFGQVRDDEVMALLASARRRVDTTGEGHPSRRDRRV
jgi:putative phosphoribosyl transferase